MVNTNTVLTSIAFSQTIDWNIKQFFNSTSIKSPFELKRIGKANIREQIKTIKKAAKCEADILVLECMAVKPELQKISEEKIVKSEEIISENVKVVPAVQPETEKILEKERIINK